MGTGKVLGLTLLIAQAWLAPMTCWAAAGAANSASAASKSSASATANAASPSAQSQVPAPGTAVAANAAPSSGAEKATVDRIDAMAATMTQVSERIDASSLRTSWFALATVVTTGLINLAIQLWFMKHQRDLNRDQAKTQISSSFVEWQLKQLSELYGPLRALLGQSNAMYRQMNIALVEADGSKFKFVDEKGCDFDDRVFQIKYEGKWDRFRTVKHIDEVYGKGYGIEAYFDDVTSIGKQMVELIKEKAGYARSDQDELVKVMGQYLAHYSVLSRIHDRVKSGGNSDGNTKVDASATFPIELRKLVDEGFSKLNKELRDWKSQGAQVVK